MSSSNTGNAAKPDASPAPEKNVGSSAAITPPVAGSGASAAPPGQAAPVGRQVVRPGGSKKAAKSCSSKTSKGELAIMPAELTPAELATAVAVILDKFDAKWYGPGQNPRSSLDDSIAMSRELRLILEYAAAQLARCENASAGGKHPIVEEYTLTAMRSLLQAVPVLQGEDTRGADAQSLSAHPLLDETPSSIVVGVKGLEPLWDLQRGEVKEILERLLREMRAVEGVVLDRIDGFAQLIQHVVEQQLVFIFQRYAQTRAKTLSKAERSAIAKGAVATMRGLRSSARTGRS